MSLTLVITSSLTNKFTIGKKLNDINMYLNNQFVLKVVLTVVAHHVRLLHLDCLIVNEISLTIRVFAVVLLGYVTLISHKTYLV